MNFLYIIMGHFHTESAITCTWRNLVIQDNLILIPFSLRKCVEKNGKILLFLIAKRRSLNVYYLKKHANGFLLINLDNHLFQQSTYSYFLVDFL